MRFGRNGTAHVWFDCFFFFCAVCMLFIVYIAFLYGRVHALACTCACACVKDSLTKPVQP